MTVCENKIAKLMAEPVTRHWHSQKTAERVAKIKTREDIVKQGKKYCFLIIVIRSSKYKTIIKNSQKEFNKPKDPGPYNNLIVAIDTTFAQSKKEKTHSRKEEEYEKYLGIIESIHTLILQVVNEPYLEALKEEYIWYDLSSQQWFIISGAKWAK